jgi:hypothetical protein
MISTLLHLFRLFPFLCGGHRQLALENLALRQQLAVYKRTVPRPRLRTTNRLVGLAGQGLDRAEGGPRDRGSRHRIAVAASSLSRALDQAVRPADRGLLRSGL